MIRQYKMISKKLGRPASGVGTLIGLRLQPDLLKAVDAYAAAVPEATRPEAIRTVLMKWFGDHGYMPPSPSAEQKGTEAGRPMKPQSGMPSPQPIGPATEVVRAMDAAIEQHKRSTRKR